MAVHIYLCDTSLIKERYVEQNDAWFDTKVYQMKDMTKECKQLMQFIDGAAYQSDNKCLSKFNNSIVEITELSTGCKTAINCLLFPDKIFEAAEAGGNALMQILQLKEVSLHFDIWLTPISTPIKNEFILHTTGNMEGEIFEYYMDLYEKARNC